MKKFSEIDVSEILNDVNFEAPDKNGRKKLSEKEKT